MTEILAERLYSHLNRITPYVGTVEIIGTLRYEDGKAMTGTAVDAETFAGLIVSQETKYLRCVFSQRTATSMM